MSWKLLSEFQFCIFAGRHHKKEGRFANRGPPLKPPIVISAEKVLQQNTQFEE